MKQKIKPINNEQKMTIQLWLGVALAIFGIILIVASFMCPPVGVVDASVLATLGDVFTCSGSLIGIDYHYKMKNNEIKYKYKEDEDISEENIQQ